MNHIEHISKYCNDEEILDTLEQLGEILYDLDEEITEKEIKNRRENSPTWKEAICDDYLNEYRKSIRPGPPWHQRTVSIKKKIWGLDLDLRTRERHKKVSELCANLCKRIGARKQALGSIYPAEGYLGWHTNANAPGRNLIFTWSKTGKGVFRYERSVPEGKMLKYDIPDHIGWNVKSFDWFGHKEVSRTGYTWHCAGTEDLRCTIAFIIHSNAMSDMLLEEDFNLHSWSEGCFVSDDKNVKSEWWEGKKEEIETMKLRPDIQLDDGIVTRLRTIKV